ncbi:MAG TPA: hypothetical protein VLB90_03425 [Pseudomonadales bacterium]|nr:hypothetical protein [Pseudomonadales bacterium]
MSDIHIDDFYKDAARVLLVLYQYFPRPYTVYVADISGFDEPDEYGLHSDRHQACFSTMIWLADAGLLRYVDIINKDAIDQAVLTQRALTLLTTRSAIRFQPEEETMPPSVADEHASHVHQLRFAIKSGASFTVRRIMQHLLNEAKHH